MIFCYFVGPFKEKRFEQLVVDYQKRLSRLWPVTVSEVSEDFKSIQKIMDSKKNKGDLVSLDAHGKSMDSQAFASWVTAFPRDIHFFAWGAERPTKGLVGLPSKSLSLSPMTYSHELARVLLMEQLYRAGALLRGHPYPK